METPKAAAAPVEELLEQADQPDRQPCPGCWNEMPGLKGARLSICPVCGYKESCCY